tara:strand:+ start:818 stop:1060 length:243 start_codon:yes stop_codon:yes gene_type:complete
MLKIQKSILDEKILMKELTAKYDVKITLLDFDKESKKLMKNFPPETKLLITVIKTDSITVSIMENPNKDASDRETWSFNF